MTAAQVFFEPRQLRDAERLSWALGELRLTIEQRSSGLYVEASYAAAQSSNPWAQLDPSESGEIEPQLKKLIAGVPPETGFYLRPKLADRPMVARPEFEVIVSPGSRLEVFLTSPIWVELSAKGKSLAEFPTRDPAKTWFGEDATRGILAYALRTRLRTTPALLSESRARVTTRAVILNEGGSPVHLSRAAIPLPSMKLHVDEDDRCWSDSISITCSESHAATVKVLSPPPEEEARARHTIGARTPPRPDGLIEAFTSILTNPFAYVG